MTNRHTLIPYFTAYLIHYFIPQKHRGDRKKRTSDSKLASKYTVIMQLKKVYLECIKLIYLNKISV